MPNLEPLLARVDALLAAGAPVRLAIDGNCASGKSTLGERLHALRPSNLLHMDDFYIPFAQKTPRRLAEPGGNVDYERFRAEILERPADAPIEYRRFDCALQRILPARTLPPQPLTIVEGSYALHPALSEFYQIRVFMTVDPQEQLARILRRNGPEQQRRFIEMWIPLENAYFDALNIRAQCDFAFDTTGEAL